MILHQGVRLHMAKQPEDQPVAACGRRVNQAEPEQIAISEHKTQNIHTDAQQEAWQECPDAISVYLHRVLQMGIRCEAFPLKAKPDGVERFATKDHPAD